MKLSKLERIVEQQLARAQLAGGQFVLRRKRDGWFVAPGSKHTSDPATAIHLDGDEAKDWLREWGSGYEVVPLSQAKEVIE